VFLSPGRPCIETPRVLVPEEDLSTGDDAGVADTRWRDLGWFRIEPEHKKIYICQNGVLVKGSFGDIKAV